VFPTRAPASTWRCSKHHVRMQLSKELMSGDPLLQIPEIPRVAPNKLVFLGGAPGVGKSTSARLLRTLLPGAATIEVDDMRACLHDVDWQSWTHHCTALDAALTAADMLLSAGRVPVIVLDAFGDAALAHALARVGREPLVLSLWACGEELAARILSRPVDHFRNISVSDEINDQIAVTGAAPGRTLIDTSGKTPESVAGAIHALLVGAGL